MKEKEEKYQAIDQQINQSLRHYRVPSSVEKDAALNSVLHKIKSRSSGESRTITLPVWLRASVAIAATVVLVYLLWGVFNTRSVESGMKEVVSFRLPDQSRVVLASNSSVIYGKFLWNREIRLKGEAYFEVEKGKRFNVLVSEGSVEVLGTRFLVNEKNDHLRVICFEGKVKASFHDNDIILLPGSGVTLSDSEKQTKFPENATYPGLAIFHARYTNAELGLIISDLESFFGIRIRNRVTQNRFFSGSFDTGNLQTALSIVTGSLGLKFEIQKDNTVHIY